MEIVFESNIPIGGSRGAVKTEVSAAISNMDANLSFLVPSEPEEDVNTVRRKISQLASKEGRHNNKKFTVRVTPQGVRVWRVR